MGGGIADLFLKQVFFGCDTCAAKTSKNGKGDFSSKKGVTATTASQAEKALAEAERAEAQLAWDAARIAELEDQTREEHARGEPSPKPTSLVAVPTWIFFGSPENNKRPLDRKLQHGWFVGPKNAWASASGLVQLEEQAKSWNKKDRRAARLRAGSRPGASEPSEAGRWAPANRAER